MDKLSIKNEMMCFDRKDRDFYQDLTDEERRKFSNYLMIRWGSAVRGSRELQEFYVIATNERLNRHFFAVNRHPKLQWLMATSVSPGLGAQDHVWIAPKKKETGSNEIKKVLLDLYPAMKIADIEALSALVDRKELKEYLREHGNPD
jgi:hypothetical protein